MNRFWIWNRNDGDEIKYRNECFALDRIRDYQERESNFPKPEYCRKRNSERYVDHPGQTNHKHRLFSGHLELMRDIESQDDSAKINDERGYHDVMLDNLEDLGYIKKTTDPKKIKIRTDVNSKPCLYRVSDKTMAVGLAYWDWPLYFQYDLTSRGKRALAMHQRGKKHDVEQYPDRPLRSLEMIMLLGEKPLRILN